MRIDERNVERSHEDIFIRYRNEHSSINNRRRPIPKNGAIRLECRSRLIDDVFKDGVGGIELRYPGYELRWTSSRIRNKATIGAYHLTG